VPGVEPEAKITLEGDKKSEIKTGDSLLQKEKKPRLPPGGREGKKAKRGFL